MLRQGEGEIVRLLLGDGAFVSPGLDLIQEDIARPAEPGGGAEVVKPGDGITQFVKNEQVLAPGNFCDKLSQKFDDRFICQFGCSLWPNFSVTRFDPSWQFGDNLSPNCLVSVDKIKALHIPQIARREAGRGRKRMLQIRCDRFDYRLAPSKCLLLFRNPTSNVPVKQDQVTIDRPCRGEAGG